MRSTAIGRGVYSDGCAARLRGSRRRSRGDACPRRPRAGSAPRPASRSAGRSARAPRAGCCTSRTPASAASCRPGRRGTSPRPRRGTRGSADRAWTSLSSIALDLELALAHVLDVLRRAEEEIDDRADERRHEAEDGRHRHEPRILDRAGARPCRPSRRSRARRRRRRRSDRLRMTIHGAGVEEVVDSSEQVVVGCRRGEDHKSSIPTK